MDRKALYVPPQPDHFVAGSPSPDERSVLFPLLPVSLKTRCYPARPAVEPAPYTSTGRANGAIPIPPLQSCRADCLSTHLPGPKCGQHGLIKATHLKQSTLQIRKEFCIVPGFRIFRNSETLITNPVHKLLRLSTQGHFSLNNPQ